MGPDASENARSAARPSFGLPDLLVAIQPRVSLAARPEKREYSGQFRGSSGESRLKGGHLGNVQSHRLDDQGVAAGASLLARPLSRLWSLYRGAKRLPPLLRR